ncbi:MAG: hypothetical protein L0Y45_11475 [Woeseiaceae bacterium]|nr:hypothetical protein [Woeseiaceae bacterium]
MRRHVLTILAFIVATFVTQALSHFVVAADHYAAVTYIRKEPIFAFGFLAMVIQGAILSALYSQLTNRYGSTVAKALGFSCLMGVFLVSYIALAEAAKYQVPNIASWIGVELTSNLVQFSLFGSFLNFIYRNAATGNSGGSRAL